MLKSRINNLLSVFKDAFKNFSKDKVPKLSGSLAYFTIFSIGPMLLVIVFIAGLFLQRAAVAGSLYDELYRTVGASSARLVQQLIKGAASGEGGVIAFVIGIVTLLIAATTIFAEMHDSMDTIFKLGKKPGLGWRQLFIPRLVSLGVIASIGFLLIVSLAASALMEGLKDTLVKFLPAGGVELVYVISLAFTLIVAILLFAIIFRLLPSAELKWKDVWPGAIVTSILFMLGRFAISFYISRNNFGTTYGAAGALVVLLVWIYYSSLIVYFGAEFTRSYTSISGSGIRPRHYAVLLETPARQT
jgi:membrane protein